MLTFDKERLLLLHPIRSNKNLKKFTEGSLTEKEVNTLLENELNEKYESDTDAWLEAFMGQTVELREGLREQIDSTLGIRSSSDYYDGVPFRTHGRLIRNRILRKLALLHLKTRIYFHELFNKKLSDDEFFEIVKKNDSELKEVPVEELRKLSLKVKNMAYQKAVGVDLEKEIKLKLYENTLIKDGNFKTYIEEKTLVDFIKMTNGGLALIEIEYFPYEIPEDVYDSIEKADNLKVFNNFYILYKLKDFEYKKFKEVAEKNDRILKDPIVFGVIDNSTKLYFIDDWVTDYCDLTFETIIEKVGKENKKTLEEK